MVKRKIESKVADIQVSDEDLELLEKELIEEMEEIVQEQLSTLRDLLSQQELSENIECDKIWKEEESKYDEGPIHNFYWGPEGEIIFFDD